VKGTRTHSRPGNGSLVRWREETASAFAEESSVRWRSARWSGMRYMQSTPIQAEFSTEAAGDPGDNVVVVG